MMISLQYSIKSGSMATLALLFLEIVLATQDLWCFHANFKAICSSSVKNAIGIFIWIALNL